MSRGRSFKRAVAPLVAVCWCALALPGSTYAGTIGADVIVSDINGMASYGTVMTCTTHRAECSSDADCNACSSSGNPCAADTDCAAGETCIISGDACDVEIAAFAIGTTACNVGDVELNWCNLDTAFCNEDQHPAIAQNMYRLLNGRFEQVGMSWVKHGFAAIDNQGCGLTCTNSGTQYLLGVGCSDVYSPNLNGSQRYLGPRSEVDPNTGLFPFPYNLHSNEIGDKPFKRLQVHSSDLMPALNGGARYFAEAHYVMSDDAADRNGNNNASTQEITIEGPNEQGHYIHDFVGGTIRGLPAIRAWADSDPSVVESDVQVPGEGLFILSGKATLLATGYWHYEYALYNMNSDRAADTFFVPLPPGAIVQNVGFHDVEYHSDEPYDGTDWGHSVAPAGITWATVPHATNTNANALRWSTLYNFRFETNVGPDPTPGTAVVGLFKPGTPESMDATALVPLFGVVDCNDNGTADDVDITLGTSQDCDTNAVPDECQADCNGNLKADTCDITDGTSADCNGNTVPDDCDPDCNNNGIVDGCFDDPLVPDTDADGFGDCADLCPLTTPPLACDCPPAVCCDLRPLLPECYVQVDWFECIDVWGGIPACMPSDLCRDGCRIGDANDNGSLDLRDWGRLQDCFSGPFDGPGYSAPSAECASWFDFDGDGDVDTADSAAWYGAAHPGG